MTTEILRYGRYHSIHIVTDGAETARLTPDIDVSGMSAEIQAVAAEFWTDEIKQGYQEHLTAKATEKAERDAKWDADAQKRTNVTARRNLTETDWHMRRGIEKILRTMPEFSVLWDEMDERQGWREEVIE